MVVRILIFSLVLSISFLFVSRPVFASSIESSDEAFMGEDIPRLATDYGFVDSFMEEFLNRVSFFIGHNFSDRLEGLFYADGSVKNTGTNTAFSMGMRGHIYNLTENLRLSMEIGYNTSRSLNPTPFKSTDSSGVFRLSFFNLVSLVEFKIFENLDSFAGLNFTFPITNPSLFGLAGDMGFQGGASYNLLEHIWLEGLVKVNNMNMRNNLGEKRDVSLAGLEIRGRYSF